MQKTHPLPAAKTSQVADSASAFLDVLQPGFLSGFAFIDWLRMLRANDWSIDLMCLPRALAATLGAFGTSVFKLLEEEAHLDAYAEEAWQHPLFILGLPRSGTTHLFELMSADPKFCFATRLDVYNPHTFLTLRQLGIDKLLGAVPLKRRAIDNVRTGWLTPEEDVLALSVLGGLGWRLRHVFPRTVHLTPSEVASLGETAAFTTALRFFTRKLVHLHRKPVLLKSPTHIDWIPGILRVFPAARFVVIFRDPVRHYASQHAVSMMRGPRWSSLQCSHENEDAHHLAATESTLNRYFDVNRALIPRNRLVEIRHEDLAADETATLGRIHEALAGSSPPWLAPSLPLSLPPRPYQPNIYGELGQAELRRIRQAYRRLYEHGFYPVAAGPDMNPLGS